MFGGYPEVIKESNTEIKAKLLSDIFSLCIEKDISSLFGITEANKFMEFSKSASFNISNILLLSSLANDINSTHYKAEQFLNALINTYLVRTIPPFHRNLLTELKKAQKLYFIDLGLRNSVIGNFTEFDKRDDRGKLMKNFVYRELLAMGYDLRYWRTTGNAEMDFVIDSPNGI
ncbi:ATPase, partial [mine drainage metagenome]